MAAEVRLQPAAQKVADAAAALGLSIEVREFDESTRTAAEAAAAVGCALGQIVKSLVFLAAGQPVLALVSGSNQLATPKLAALCGTSGKQVQRADADAVRAATGFAAGGVPPFGHAGALRVFIDEDLGQYPTVWAAAGTPHAVFEIEFAALQRATGGLCANLKSQ